MEEIADQNDDELTQWERIMRINKFMLDHGIKKEIYKYLEPVFEGQEMLIRDV